MAAFNVTAPSGDYSGLVGKVQFQDGKAAMDDEANAAELAYCRAAGYLIEEAAGNEQDRNSEQGGDGPFDPADHDMPSVLAHLKDADRDEAERVLDAEAAAAKPRKGIVDQRDAILDSKKEEQ